MATRPQSTFGWHLGHYDFSESGLQTFMIFVLSRLGDGVGSILADTARFDAKLVASENTTVGAGDFESWHFELAEHDNPSHRYEVWIEKKNFLTLKLVDPRMKRVYELVELGPTYSE